MGVDVVGLKGVKRPRVGGGGGGEESGVVQGVCEALLALSQISPADGDVGTTAVSDLAAAPMLTSIPPAAGEEKGISCRREVATGPPSSLSSSSTAKDDEAGRWQDEEGETATLVIASKPHLVEGFQTTSG